MNARIWQ